MPASPTLDWSGLTSLIAQTGHVPADLIRPDSVLTDDLGLDSLDLAELAMALAEHRPATGDRPLTTRDWSGLTAGDLLRELQPEDAS